MGTFRKNFGGRLQYLRKLKGMTQEQLAERADLSWSQVNAIEGGRSSPSFDSLERISRALGIRPRELFDYPDAATEPPRLDPLWKAYESLERLPKRQLLLILGMVGKALALVKRR